MIRLIRKLGRFLAYGGFSGPKPYETEILDTTVAGLPEPDAEALRRQIQQIERLQRWNDDRMVIVGFEDKRALETLENENTDHALSKLRLKGAFGSIIATVMTHRGVLSSLEFRPSPRKMNGHDFSVELLQLHSSDPGASSAIDKDEHPRAAAEQPG
jgi:hypothetical protein